MAKYPYRKLGTNLDRDYRNDLNKNFEDIETDIKNTKETAEQLLDESFETGALNTNIEERLDSLETEYAPKLTQVTQQLADTVADKANFRSKSDDVTYGNELLTASGWTTTGWTGDFSTGYTHIVGQISPLSYTIAGLDATSIYLIEFNATNTGTGGGISDFYVSLGGSDQFETYKGVATKYTYAMKSGGLDNNLVITPIAGYTGKISNLTVKKVSGIIPATVTIFDKNERVSAEIRSSNSLLFNTFFGRYAGQYNVGDQNTAFGHSAMLSNSTGFWNTALGFEALRDNTVGTRNVAIGKIALSQNISGDRNIAIGTFAMRGNLTGRANIALGADALWYNDDGSYNVAIGLVAMGNNTSGNNNIGLGERVMSASQGGEHNVALGQTALYYNTGDDNVAIGRQAMYRNMKGIGNVGIGKFANFMNEAGSDNVAIGQRALQKNTSNNNIAIGFESSYESLTGHSNIAVGYQASRKNLTGNYNLALGHSALFNNASGGGNVALGQNTLLNANAVNNIAVGTNALANNTTGDANVSIGYNSGGAVGTPGILIRNVLIGYRTGVNMSDGSDYNIVVGASSGTTLTSGKENILIGFNVQASSPTAIKELNIGNVIKGNLTTRVVEVANLKITALPTINPGVAGQLWNDGGTLKVS